MRIEIEQLSCCTASKIHTILTDNGVQFAKREGAEEYAILPLDRVCLAMNIDHRLTTIKHPWTNG